MTNTQNQALTDERTPPAKLKYSPGDDMHLTVLMARHGLNMVVGSDRKALLAWGRDVWGAALASQAAGQERVKFPGRYIVEREIEASEFPQGMRVNDGMEHVTLPRGTLRRMLALIDRAAPVAQQAPTQLEHANACRIELVTLIDGLVSQIENTMYAFRSDEAAIRKAEGAIAHARKVAAAWNWNGPWVAQQAPQSAASVPEGWPPVHQIATWALEAIEAGDRAAVVMNVEGVKQHLRRLIAAAPQPQKEQP